jgi:DNA modification methylase
VEVFVGGGAGGDCGFGLEGGVNVNLLQGDCLGVLREMAAESVNCVVTSPPYWGLRDYGTHRQIGLEKTPEEYVAKLVGVFAEIRRVLKPDGTAWLNLGDSYANDGKFGGETGGKQAYLDDNNRKSVGRKKRQTGLKPKDLIGIPWRVAFALQADGWWLRGDHVWGKPNGMPESVEDRPTRSHEYVFMLTKSERYYYDSKAVITAPKASTITRLAQDIENQQGSSRANGGAKTNGPMKTVGVADGANLRSIWWIPPAQCKASHFAVMPARVAQICILAGCPEGGTVLDPFMGSGTTLVVAIANGCNGIGIELNPDYIAMAQRRLAQSVLDFAEAPA